MRTAAVAIHLIPDDAFDDWVVRDDGGREIGHCPTRERPNWLLRNSFAGAAARS